MTSAVLYSVVLQVLRDLSSYYMGKMFALHNNQHTSSLFTDWKLDEVLAHAIHM